MLPLTIDWWSTSVKHPVLGINQWFEIIKDKKNSKDCQIIFDRNSTFDPKDQKTWKLATTIIFLYLYNKESE